MPRDSFSVLISPTYRCNADCEYCFENKTSDMMTLGEFELLFQRISDYLRQQDVSNLTIYWVGGEIFVMDPEWLLRAHDMIRDRAEKAGINVQNLLQSNLVAYGPRWRTVVAEMFNNSLGSSLDFPNLYRKLAGGTPDTFNQTWYRKLEEAKEAGIQVGIIALLHDGTLSAGAEQFYSYYVEDLGVTRFQINTPYPGGHPTPVKQGFPLDNDLLSAFYSDLFDLWMRRGRPEGISIGPLDELVDYFLTGENRLSCIWGENCANSFIGVSPKGDVGQCEGWVASYPDHVYGNLFTSRNLVDIMNSPVRKQLLERPVRLMQEKDCAKCEYLALCHGGCAVRAYSSTGNLFAKDPYCQSDKTLFRLARNAAVEIDRLEITRRAGRRAASCE